MRTWDDWLVYMAGALGLLGMKFWGWCRDGKAQGKPFRQSAREWFSLVLLKDKVSWLATVAVVWCGGYIYLERVKVGWEWVEALPIAWPFDFLLGIIMEYTAPNAFKWLVGRLPFGQDVTPQQ